MLVCCTLKSIRSSEMNNFTKTITFCGSGMFGPGVLVNGGRIGQWEEVSQSLETLRLLGVPVHCRPPLVCLIPLLCVVRGVSPDCGVSGVSLGRGDGVERSQSSSSSSLIERSLSVSVLPNICVRMSSEVSSDWILSGSSGEYINVDIGELI